jgi:hypothetical protein
VADTYRVEFYGDKPPTDKLLSALAAADIQLLTAHEPRGGTIAPGGGEIPPMGHRIVARLQAASEQDAKTKVQTAVGFTGAYGRFTATKE